MGPIQYQFQNQEFSFNDLVCIEGLIGYPLPKRTGRLVQVRKGVGAFGSDIYLVRLRDGDLRSFENVFIFKAGGKSLFHFHQGHLPEIPDQPPYPGDSPTTEYTQNHVVETGFVVENPSQPASTKQSFAMRIAH